MYFEIKAALIEKLREGFPEYQVFFEDVKRGTENYFVVDIGSPSFSTIDEDLTAKKYEICISAVTSEATNRNLALVLSDLDKLIRPVFSFGDRHITINTVQIKTVDSVLHYIFELVFLDSEGDTFGA